MTASVKPATPVINVVADDDKVNAAEKDAATGVTVSGITEASASVTVNWGSTSKTVTADSAGHWSASFAKAETNFISDAYTKFMVNTRPESNQRPSFKLYATVSGLFQRWFSANVETPPKSEAFLQ